MSDITLCREESCPKKESCLRWIEPPSHETKYFVFDPRNDEGNCEKYIEIKPTVIDRKLSDL